MLFGAWFGTGWSVFPPLLPYLYYSVKTLTVIDFMGIRTLLQKWYKWDFSAIMGGHKITKKSTWLPRRNQVRFVEFINEMGTPTVTYINWQNPSLFHEDVNQSSNSIYMPFRPLYFPFWSDLLLPLPLFTNKRLFRDPDRYPYFNFHMGRYEYL